jgi:hypothetical protein
VGEIANIVGIYGAIDDAVRPDTDDGRARRVEVQDLLPAYRDEATHWAGQFRETAARVRPEAAALPEWKEALLRLSEIPASGRMRARRLMVVAAALRAFREIREDTELLTLARNAIVFEGARDVNGQEALLHVLGDAQLMVEDLDQWWQRVTEVAAEVRFVESAALLGPRPCIGQLTDSPSGPATVLITRFVTDVCDFERAILFLEPATWPDNHGFWCAMDYTGIELPPGTRHYDETVAVDCPAASAFWTVSAKLGFRFRRTDDAAWTTYDLSGPPDEDDDLLVDRGILRIKKLPDGRLDVHTSKQVLFRGAFGGQGLAMMMCALGYASVVEDLIYTYAIGDAPGAPFPGGGDQKKGPTGAPPGVIEGRLRALIDHVAASAKTCVDDFEASSKKVGDKTYTADDLASDIARVGTRMVRESAQAVDILWTKGE